MIWKKTIDKLPPKWKEILFVFEDDGKQEVYFGCLADNNFFSRVDRFGNLDYFGKDVVPSWTYLPEPPEKE